MPPAAYQNPTALVIFGITGDLAQQRLIPSLFRLWQRGLTGQRLLPDRFHVIGFGRREWNDADLRQFAVQALADAGLGSAAERQTFSNLLAYQRGQFDDLEAFRALAQRLGFEKGQWQSCYHRLLYLSTPPGLFPLIFQQLAASGLATPCGDGQGSTRLLVEKPFGRDLATAQALDQQLGHLFREEQVFRIDHYLAREAIQNILAFRFSNAIFEPIWNADHIEAVEIRALERIGVGNRGATYDGVGALRDFGQNHLLQLLATVTMEHPGNLSDRAIRSARAEALAQLAPIPPKLIPQRTSRAQYRGYRGEPGVQPDSTTETYFRLTAQLASRRWAGVPFRLESGKRLPLDADKRTDITVRFRHPEPCLCPRGSEHTRNSITFLIQPELGIDAVFWAKRPGPGLQLVPQHLSFRYSEADRGRQFEAYDRILLDALTGDQTLFVRTDEALASWRFIDPILRSWGEGEPPLRIYEPGTMPDLITN